MIAVVMWMRFAINLIVCETHRGFHASLGRGQGVTPAPTVKAALRCRARGRGGRAPPLPTAPARRGRARPLPRVNTALPSPRPAAPAPAVRRRENLRSASFRDYAMGRWHGWPVLRSVVARGLLITASRANGMESGRDSVR